MTDTDSDPEPLPESGMRGLTDRTAIVTGSTRGIGRGIARRFAAEEMNVVVTGRSVDDGETVAADIRDAGGEAVFVEADMAVVDDIELLVEATVDRYGSVDVVVNNAAAWQHTRVQDGALDDWEFVMDVSLRAPWYLSKVALEHMPAGGSIVNVSSLHGSRTDPGRFPYNVAKAGLNGLTRAMAVDFGQEGVRVNGLIVGNIVKEYDVHDPHDESNWEARLLPVYQRGEPSDVAAITTFLAADEARFITGANIPVDGGRLVAAANSEWPPNEETDPDHLHSYGDRVTEN